MIKLAKKEENKNTVLFHSYREAIGGTQVSLCLLSVCLSVCRADWSNSNFSQKKKRQGNRSSRFSWWSIFFFFLWLCLFQWFGHLWFCPLLFFALSFSVQIHSSWTNPSIMTHSFMYKMNSFWIINGFLCIWLSICLDSSLFFCSIIFVFLLYMRLNICFVSLICFNSNSIFLIIHRLILMIFYCFNFIFDKNYYFCLADHVYECGICIICVNKCEWDLGLCVANMFQLQPCWS